MTDKLTLKKDMCSSYLIQRLHKPYIGKLAEVGNVFAFGSGLKNGGLSEEAMMLIKGIFSFDYMGSAEFEFGAVPACLKFLAEQSQSLSVGEMSVHGKSIYYVSPYSYEQEVKNRIAQLAYDEYAFSKKEYCGLKATLTDENEYSQRNVGWLELDNGYAFFTDKEMFERFCRLFGLSKP